MDHNFDDLSHAALSIHNRMGEHELWRAAMSLRVWYFLARGEGDEAEPMIAPVNGRPHLLAFTDEDKADVGAGAVEARKGPPRPGILEMDVEDAVGYCRELEELGVDFILFNGGEHSFVCTMTQLRDMHSRYAPKR